jgi:hypothetical protein
LWEGKLSWFVEKPDDYLDVHGRAEDCILCKGLQVVPGRNADRHEFTCIDASGRQVVCAVDYEEDRARWMKRLRSASSLLSQEEMDNDRALEWVHTITLDNTALRNWRSSQLHMRKEEDENIVQISASFRLGGVLLVQGESEEIRNAMLKLIAGVETTHKNSIGMMHVPAFLRYAYVYETPLLLEGSILKNLLLAVKPCSAKCYDVTSENAEILNSCGLCNRVSNDQAWEIARRCGLSEEYLNAPEAFRYKFSKEHVT